MRKPKPTPVANLEGMIVLAVLTLALVGATAGITVWLVDENSSRAEAAVVETGEETATDAETVKGYVQGFADAGCDELILIPCDPDPAQVDLLADAIA